MSNLSSILTNMSALTAVQNLNATEAALAKTQSEISTGLSVSSAEDNAAYFSIAQTMRTNVSDLSAVSSSLNLGSSVVSTATAATNQITSVLQSISADLVTAKSNVGNTSTQSYLQTAITALNQQLASIVSSASFNGSNLLDGSSGASVSFVSGLTGTGSNTVVNSLTINTSGTNLSGATYAGGNALVNSYVNALSAQATAQTSYNTAQTTFLTAYNALTSTDFAQATATTPVYTAAYQAAFGTATDTSGVIGGTIGGAAAALIGSGGSFTLSTGAYTAGTTAAAGGALYALGGNAATGSTANQTVTPAAGATTGAIYTTSQALEAAQANATSAQIVNGALFNVGQISLTSNTSSAQIDAYIKEVGTAITAVNTASEQLGAASSQIDLQTTYISSLSDSLTSGVGSLVDADMNEASTRLNALQTQQQLGVQALSVANQNSQLILKLFTNA